MHQPTLRTHRKRVGMTGDIRFRSQWFTGRQILQVAIIYEVTKYRYPHELTAPNRMFTTEVEWEDADASAALRLSCGFPPFERKKADPPHTLRPSQAPMWGAGSCSREFGPKTCKHEWFFSAGGGPGIEEGEFCRFCGIKRPPRNP